MTDLTLAHKVYARGLNLSGSERDWEAFHLAKDVLELAGALRIGEELKLWEPGRAGYVAAQQRFFDACDALLAEQEKEQR